MSIIPGPDPRIFEEVKQSFTKYLFLQLFSVNPIHWLFLAFVGILAVVTGVFIDSFSGILRKGTPVPCLGGEACVLFLPSGLNFIFYLAWGLFFCYIAGSVGYSAVTVDCG